jgi:hypothetical protein
VWRNLEDAAAFDQDVARGGHVETAEAVEERRLASAVWSDQTEQLSCPKIKRHSVERHDAAKTNDDIADLQQRLGCGHHGRRLGRAPGSIHRPGLRRFEQHGGGLPQGGDSRGRERAKRRRSRLSGSGLDMVPHMPPASPRLRSRAE